MATFFDDMDAQLERAHLVIGRAGASTVAELSVVGRPALLVPYPHATDDHQTENARAVEAAGAGWLMPQTGFSAEALAARLEAFMTCPDTLIRAAAAGLVWSRPDAAVRLADAIDRLIGSNGHHGGHDMRERAA